MNGVSKRGVFVWLSPHFPRRQNTENPVPLSFFAPKPYGNAYYEGYTKTRDPLRFTKPENSHGPPDWSNELE